MQLLIKQFGINVGSHQALSTAAWSLIVT